MARKKYRPRLVKRFVVVLFCALFAFIGYRILFGANAATGDYSPQPERRFTLLGHLHGQFTENEFRILSTDYARVIINKLHGNTIQDSFDAAKELKRRNSNLKIEIYWNTKYWYDSNQTRLIEGDGFNPLNKEKCTGSKINGLCSEWYLRDTSGNIVSQHQKSDDGNNINENAQYYDLSNASFRDWAVAVLQHWLNKAPFDGIHFDSGSDLANGFDGYNWTRTIGDTKLAAYNAGMKDLFVRANQLANAKEVTYNGFAPATFRGVTRGLEKLSYMDGATDEGFCLSSGGIRTDYVLADINIMKAHPDNYMMLHSSYNKNLPTSGAKPAGRFCHAAFLMGWQPGSTFHKFAIGSYGSDTLQYDLPSPDKALLPELSLNLGHPTEAYKISGNLLTRQFEHGFVAVNIGTSNTTVTLPFGVRRVEDGQDKGSYAQGATYTVPATTGVYFLKVSSQTGGGGSSGGTTNGGGTTGGGTNATGTTTSVAEAEAEAQATEKAIIHSVGDIPSVLANDFLHPSRIDDTIRDTSNKGLVTVFIFAYLFSLAVVIVPAYLLLRHFGVIKQFRATLQSLRNKLFPPRWR